MKKTKTYTLVQFGKDDITGFKNLLALENYAKKNGIINYTFSVIIEMTR
jgi:hypothetical protein